MAEAMHDHYANEIAASLGLAASEATIAGVRMNLRKYLAYLDDTPLSDEEKLRLIAEVFRFGVAFVDGGFNVEMSFDDCGKLASQSEECGAKGADMVCSQKSKPTNTFNEEACPRTPRTARTKENPWTH